MWYVPFFAMIYVLNDEADVLLMFRLICYCAVFNTALEFAEFHFKHHLLINIFPKSMQESIIQSNPMFINIVEETMAYRDGIFRASSTFLVPLSFGEFEIIVIPLALFLAMHRRAFFERCLGWMRRSRADS
jgi:hypothetical protein